MMKRCIQAIFLWLALCGTLFAAGGAGDVKSNQPIQIKSNELLTDNTSRTATFTGKVVARQGDVTIYCDRLVIYQSEKAKDVERVEAFGNVRIVQGNRSGQAGHAVYENGKGKITLDDNPRVVQGDDVVTGKVIIYFLNEQKSVVSGGAEAVIHPKGKEKDGDAKP